jgi:hypothetical protein
MAVDGTVEQTPDRRHLPPPTHQSRLGTCQSAVTLAHTQQAAGQDRCVSTFDLNRLRLTESRSVLNQARGGRANHHPARWSDRLHALGHPHLLTDRGVTQSAGADFTGDHLTRVQADTQPQVDPIAVFDLSGQWGRSS